MPRSPGHAFFLLDASVIFAGLVGTGPSATILTTVQLGGMSGCAVENSMEEVRVHLLEYFNRKRLKLHATEATRLLKDLREAPSFDVHPWLTAPASLLPDNRKDAYLLAAADKYKPRILLTLDTELIAIGKHGDTQISTPQLVLDIIDELDLAP